MKMKAAESRERKRSLSTGVDEESAAKRNKKEIPKITGNKDVYCWTCHKPGNVATCSECPRAYHLKCGHLDEIPKPSEKWVCPECDTVQRADNQAPSSPAHKSSFSKLLMFVLDRVKRVDGVDNFSTPVDTNKWHDYLDYVVQPMDLPKLRSNVDAQKYRSVESFLADFRWLVHASYVYNSVHSVYTKIAKSMMNVAKNECEEVKNCSECYMHACTLGDNWFIEPCTTPHVLVWAQLSGFPYWPAKVMRQLSGDVVDVRFFGDHTRANVPAASCFLYSRVMPCSVKSKKHSSKITSGIEEAEEYVKNLKSTYNSFCYAQYRVNYLPKEEECMRKLQLPEFPIANETPEFIAKVESMRKEKMLEDKKFHSEMKQMISEQEKSKRAVVPQKRKSLDGGGKLLLMSRKLVKIDTPVGQKLAIMNVSSSESESSPKHTPQARSPAKSQTSECKSDGKVQPEMNGDHNANKSPPKVDDETIRQVLARSPKEVSLLPEVSPKALTPPKDSGIIESLSRKLFTSTKKLANGSEGSRQARRSLSRQLNSLESDVPLESDSDSDALVIAEEPSPDGVSSDQTTSVTNPNVRILKRGVIPLKADCLKKQPSAETKPNVILVRKTYISTENVSPATRISSALPSGGTKVPVPGRKTVIVHRAVPPTVSETTEAKSPPISRRTRSSINLEASVAKEPIDVPNEQPAVSVGSSAKEPTPTITPMQNEVCSVDEPKGRSEKGSEPQTVEPSKQDYQPTESCLSAAETEELENVPRKSSEEVKPDSQSTNNALSGVPLPEEDTLGRVAADVAGPLTKSCEHLSVSSLEALAEPATALVSPLSLGISSAQVKENLSMERRDESSMKPSQASIGHHAEDSHKLDEKRKFQLLEAKEVDSSSTSGARMTQSASASDLPSGSLPKRADVPSAGNEGLQLLNSGDGDCNEKDSSVIGVVNSSGNLTQESAGLPATPDKSVHSAKVTTTQSPGVSSISSTPEKSLTDAVQKVPSSMEVPVIKVVRAQCVTPRKEEAKSIENSFESNVASNDKPSEAISVVEPCNRDDASSIDCAASFAGATVRSPVVGIVPSSKESSVSCTTDQPTRSSEDAVTNDVNETPEHPVTISSLDMLDGDLSHLYGDLEPPEDDDESDEPASSGPAPEDEVVPTRPDEPLKEPSDPVQDLQVHRNSEREQPEAMDCDETCPVDAAESTPKKIPEEDSDGTIPVDGVESTTKKIPDNTAPTPLSDSTDNSHSAAEPVAHTKSDPSAESQPVTNLTQGDGNTSPDVLSESHAETPAANQPATDSKTEPIVSSTSLSSLESTKSKSQSPNPDRSPKEIPTTPGNTPEKLPDDVPEKIINDSSENTTKDAPETIAKGSLDKMPDLVPHTPEKSDGKCTCIMCHVAHPGASFDKTVEDYQLMKSIELDEPKRGLPIETQEFFRRLRETRDDDYDFDPSSERRESFSSGETSVSLSSREPRKSTDSLEAGPSTSSGKPSRPLPGLVTLTLPRRPSSEQRNSSEKNSLGGLQISSAISLHPSLIDQLSSNGPADQTAAARKTPSRISTSEVPSSDSQSGGDAKKVTQNATTMPLPIIVKPDPDAEEALVPTAQTPPTPTKPTIKLKQMSSLLERPPAPPSPSKPEVSSSSNNNISRKECITPKFNMLPPFEPKKTFADVRKLIESKSQFISAKLKKDIYTLFDQIENEYHSHMELLEHVADASLNSVENTLESNKNLVFEEMKIRLRNQVDAHIADVKKKQWCILCGNEAAFHCCWGYNYCCEDCQKNDWAEHTKVCTQYNMTATDPYIRASPRFQALLEKQMLNSGNKKILVQDLIDSPVAVSVQSNPPNRGRPSPLRGRKILAGPRTSFLEGELPLSLDSHASNVSIPLVPKPSLAPTPAVQRITDQVTSYKIVQPGRTVRIVNPPKPRLPQVLPKPQFAPRAAPRPAVSPPSTDLSQTGKIAARLTSLGKWGSVKISPSLEVSRAPANAINQRKTVTSGRILPGQQSSNRTSFLRVMDEQEIASILQRNHLKEYQ